jgi:predicted DNA-binding transcriptional regulator AlpA
MTQAAKTAALGILENPNMEHLENVQILRGMIDGETPAEAARRFGVSRSAIYRARHIWTVVLSAIVPQVWAETREPKVFKRGEVARMCGIPRAHVYSWLKRAEQEGLPQPLRVNGRRIWSPAVAEAWVKHFTP